MITASHPGGAPRGRLAPSPTGALHLGNARSLLLAWLSIRSRGGELILRMEDLDHPKVKPGAAGQALEDLRWLGLDWDEGPDCGGGYGPYVQSARIDNYRAALQSLLDRGLVYPCTCSRRDVEQAQSAPHGDERGRKYPGTCASLSRTYEQALQTLEEGRLPPAWRFRSPGRETRFKDGFCGLQSAHVSRDVGDFTIARHADGAGYMLGVVVDDAAMRVSEVLRGDDLLETTHQQLLLYDALGLAVPEFIHVPLVVGSDGRRLAKRHGDTRVAAIRESGVAPARVVGVLAWWCGWGAFGEELMPCDLLARYDLSQLPGSAVVLDARVKRFLGVSD